jgi:hypothetical protein
MVMLRTNDRCMLDYGNSHKHNPFVCPAYLRTKDRCTPRPLWVPAQSRQSVMPYVREHHDGFGVEHSAQTELPASERRVVCCAGVRGADFDMV